MREILYVWFKLVVVRTPLAQFHIFSIFLVKSLVWKGEIPRISKEGSEMPRGPEGGMCDAKFEPNITHFRKFCLEKNFWKCSKSLNYWKKKVFQKIAFFGAISEKVFTRSARHQAETWCKIVKSNAFLMIFFWTRSKFDVESDCEVIFVKQGEEM